MVRMSNNPIVPLLPTDIETADTTPFNLKLVECTRPVRYAMYIQTTSDFINNRRFGASPRAPAACGAFAECEGEEPNIKVALNGSITRQTSIFGFVCTKQKGLDPNLKQPNLLVRTGWSRVNIQWQHQQILIWCALRPTVLRIDHLSKYLKLRYGIQWLASTLQWHNELQWGNSFQVNNVYFATNVFYLLTKAVIANQRWYMHNLRWFLVDS